MLMIRNLSGLAFNSFDGLYKHSGLLAIVSIAGFVLQLAFLHERDTDADEHNRHSYWSADEPVNAVFVSDNLNCHRATRTKMLT